MKVTIEFTLPEEKSEHRMAMDAGMMFVALWKIRELCARQVNRNGKEHTGDEFAREIMNEIDRRVPNLEELA